MTNETARRLKEFRRERHLEKKWKNKRTVNTTALGNRTRESRNQQWLLPNRSLKSSRSKNARTVTGGHSGSIFTQYLQRTQCWLAGRSLVPFGLDPFKLTSVPQDVVFRPQYPHASHSCRLNDVGLHCCHTSCALHITSKVKNNSSRPCSFYPLFCKCQPWLFKEMEYYSAGAEE